MKRIEYLSPLTAIEEFKLLHAMLDGTPNNAGDGKDVNDWAPARTLYI